MTRWWLPCLTLASLGAVEPVVSPPPGPKITTITLRPATEPHPALKYQLVPEKYGLIPGNAALFYHRAFIFLAQRNAGIAQSPPTAPGSHPFLTSQEAYEWIDKPLADLPRDEIRLFLDRHHSVIEETKLGAKRDQCDWGLSGRDEGINLLLPEIQESRSLARLLSLQARLAIRDGRLDQAWDSIQAGYVLARHLGEGSGLIPGLVGISIGFQMNGCLELLQSSPGAPSLFWALADRPRPFIDLRDNFASDSHFIEQEFPALLELDKSVWSTDQARRLAESLQTKLFRYVDTLPGSTIAIPNGLAPDFCRLGIAVYCAQIEAEARRSLIASGKPAAEVEAMPVVQAALLHVYHQTQDRRDAVFKWANVRSPVPRNRFQPPSLSLAEKQANPLLAFFSALEYDFGPAYLASIRLDRQLDALQVVEAIRLDATRHEGRLPASLAAIADLPVPLDPATGQPFDYRVEGDTAIISAPNLADFPINSNYSINIRLVPAPR